VDSAKRCLMAAVFLAALAGCVSTAAAFTDLEVTYIGRSPKYYSYQGRVLYGGQTFTDDYIPYYATYAYGLSGQTSSTKRWPDAGETVTFTAHVYNRGDTTVSSFTYEWRLDDAVIGSGTYSTSMAPGAIATLTRTWAWHWALHRIKFTITSPTDGRSSNNFIEDYTNALGLYTFIDYGFAANFKTQSAGYPHAATDSITEWLQRHRIRENQMFEDAGSYCRWRYDRLDFVNDGDSTPSITTTNYDGSFPQRYYVTDGDVRGSGYYSATEDIDYGLCHEIGHQLGLIDVYRFDVSSEQNEVNGQGYSAMPGLMHGCDHFFSPHSALGMNQWYGKRRGYFGQYLFRVPTVNKLRLLSSEGEPLDGATVTVYQKNEIPDEGEKIKNIAKFTGTTDENGIYTFPNPNLVNKGLFWADTGDVLNNNPFGYIWCVGPNGVFLIKIEKHGAVDYVWLDLTDFNIAYWNGQTAEATFTRQTGIGRAMQFAPPTDLTELNAANWTGWAQGGTSVMSDDTSRKHVGGGSVLMDTNGPFDTSMTYPRGIVAHWNLSSVTSIFVWFYAENPNLGFQNGSPWIRLCNYSGAYVELHASYDLLNDCRGTWRSYTIPLAGNATWLRTVSGTPIMTDINFIEIHADTWDAGFKLWVDGLRFTPQPVPLDTDADGLPDYWELAYFDNIAAQNASGDPDNDGLPNGDEYAHKTDPTKSDTDGDGLSDGEEVALGFDPTDPTSGFILVSVNRSTTNPAWVSITWRAGPDTPVTLSWTSGRPASTRTWNAVDGAALSNKVYNGDLTWTWTDTGADPDMGGLAPGSVLMRFYRISSAE
jgi:hypothetical protein